MDNESVKKENEEKIEPYHFVLNELNIARHLFTLTRSDDEVSGRSVFSSAKFMWDNGHNTVVTRVAKYLYFERNITKPDELKRMLYRYLAYSSYLFRRTEDPVLYPLKKGKKAKKGKEKDSKDDSNLINDKKYKIVEFNDFNVLVNKEENIESACDRMFEFLKNQKVQESTSCSYAWHFNAALDRNNKDYHPSYIIKERGQSLYSDEENKLYWSGIDEQRDRRKLSAVIDLFSYDTIPSVVFKRGPESKKFDVIIAELKMMSVPDWISFEFDTPDATIIDKNRRKGDYRFRAYLACVIDHLMRLWFSGKHKKEKIFKPTYELGLQDISDYKMLALEHHFGAEDISFIAGDNVDWSKVSEFEFEYASPYVRNGVKHKYKISQDGLEKID